MLGPLTKDQAKRYRIMILGTTEAALPLTRAAPLKRADQATTMRILTLATEPSTKYSIHTDHRFSILHKICLQEVRGEHLVCAI